MRPEIGCWLKTGWSACVSSSSPRSRPVTTWVIERPSSRVTTSSGSASNAAYWLVNSVSPPCSRDAHRTQRGVRRWHPQVARVDVERAPRWRRAALVGDHVEVREAGDRRLARRERQLAEPTQEGHERRRRRPAGRGSRRRRAAPAGSSSSTASARVRSRRSTSVTSTPTGSRTACFTLGSSRDRRAAACATLVRNSTSRRDPGGLRHHRDHALLGERAVEPGLEEPRLARGVDAEVEQAVVAAAQRPVAGPGRSPDPLGDRVVGIHDPGVLGVLGHQRQVAPSPGRRTARSLSA